MENVEESADTEEDVQKKRMESSQSAIGLKIKLPCKCPGVGWGLQKA